MLLQHEFQLFVARAECSPCLVMRYCLGPTRRRKMPVRSILSHAEHPAQHLNVSQVVQELTQRHAAYLKGIKTSQLERIVNMLCKHHHVKTTAAAPAMQAPVKHTRDALDGKVDLNKLE